MNVLGVRVSTCARYNECAIKPKHFSFSLGLAMYRRVSIMSWYLVSSNVSIITPLGSPPNDVKTPMKGFSELPPNSAPSTLASLRIRPGPSKPPS